MALDVFESEPPPADHPLLKHPRVIKTPHLGASTSEAQVAVARQMAEQIIDALEGKMIRNAVNMPSIDPEVAGQMHPF